MNETGAPSYNRARKGTLPGVIDQAIENALNDLEHMLPATVLSYDRNNNVATVRPNILMLTTADQLVARAPLASVPVWAYGGGGFVINFPLVAGAQGWIKACDRDISLYLQSGKTSVAPNTRRIHSFSDGVFYPDFRNGYTINREDTNNAVFQTGDGTVRIAVWPNQVKISTPNANVVVGPNSVVVTGSPGVTASLAEGKILFTSPRLDIDSAEINFSSNPNVGPLPP